MTVCPVGGELFMPELPAPAPLAGLIDLHVHTTASDGALPPAQVVEMAHALGLEAVAITDHDCLDGIAEAMQAGARLAQEVIPGCELAADTPYGEMHIVGLWTLPGNPELDALLAMQQQMRECRYREILLALDRVGMPLSEDELLAEAGAGRSIGRPHIARAMVRKGYVRSVADAFRLYLSPGKAGYVERRLLKPEEILQIVKKSGATTIFAHPMSLPAPPEWIRKEAARLCSLGLLDGIEAYHPEHDRKKIQYVEKLASELDLLLSGGSDFHGAVKPAIELGVGHGQLRVPVELLLQIKKHRKQAGLAV